MADDKFGLQHAANFFAHARSRYRRDETHVANVDSQNRDSRSAESMRSLEQRAIAAAGQNEVGGWGGLLVNFAPDVLLGRQRFQPLLGDLFAVQHPFKNPRRISGVGFSLV